MVLWFVNKRNKFYPVSLAVGVLRFMPPLSLDAVWEDNRFSGPNFSHQGPLSLTWIPLNSNMDK